MSSGPGEHLLFLVSQPRAGSTLLQRILGGHPAIHTAGEPWLMLHPLYALRKEGIAADFNGEWARVIVTGFLRTLPGGVAEYDEAVRRMAGYLYERALAGSGKELFLDKTPRYYLVLPELRRVWPGARRIFLFRNPLAVLVSIYTTWTHRSLFDFYHYRHDLLRAPHLLVEELGKEGTVPVWYETLVEDPEGEVGRLCRALDLPFDPSLIAYGAGKLPRFEVGDQKAVYLHERPVPAVAQGWTQELRRPQVWRLASDYLERLDAADLRKMNYAREELAQVLEENRPARGLRWTVPLEWLLEKPRDARSRRERHRLRRLLERQERGFLGAARAALRPRPSARVQPAGDA